MANYGRALHRLQRGWVQKKFVDCSGPRRKVCLVAALGYVDRVGNYRLPAQVMRDLHHVLLADPVYRTMYVKEGAITQSVFYAWNDNPNRTKQEVLAVVSRMLRRQQARKADRRPDLAVTYPALPSASGHGLPYPTITLPQAAGEGRSSEELVGAVS